MNIQTSSQDVRVLTRSELLISSAIQLYELGLNPLPVKLPSYLQILATKYPEIDASKKLPFLHKPFFIGRMHYCSDRCKELEKLTGHPCPGRHASSKFPTLFQDSNLGLMLGRTSKNIAIIDCDDLDVFHFVRDKFLELGINHWAYLTSRGGNLLFRLREGVVKNKPKGKFPNVEIYGNNHICVPPPSVHYSGHIYTWIKDEIPYEEFPYTSLPEPTSIQQLQWLGVELAVGNHNSDTSYINNSNLPYWVYYMSKSIQGIWAMPLFEGERNTFLTKLVYECAALIENDLAPEDEVEELLYLRADTCSPPYPHYEIDQMLKSASNKTDLTLSTNFHQHTNDYPRSYFLQRIYNILQFADQYDWRIHGRTALTDRVVFFACVVRSINDRKLPFRASSREVAEIANIQSKDTVLAALKRLCDIDFLKKAGSNDFRASLYEFGCIFDVDRYAINTRDINGISINMILEKHIPLTTLEKDAFLSLRRIAYIVWKYLQTVPGARIIQISDACNLVYGSVRSSLQKLHALDLISYSRAEGLYMVNKTDAEHLEQVALQLGTFGNDSMRKLRHRVEREIRLTIKVWRAQNNFYNKIEQFYHP